MNISWMKSVPKVELHCHLDGSLPLEVIRELANRNHIDIPKDDEGLRLQLQAKKENKSLNEYLEKFDLPIRCLQRAEDLMYAAYQLVLEVAKEHVIYLEVRFAPKLHTQKSLTIHQVVEAVILGLKKGQEETQVTASAILCAMRHERQEDNMELLDVASQYLHKGVCGVDLAGNEGDFPPRLHQEFFYQAAQKEIPITIYAGECQNAQNIKDAIEMGATRIGHGIAMKGHTELIKFVKDHKIGIEMCPTSNLQTKASNSMEEYPFMEFYQQGLLVSVHTDNRTVSGTTMSEELLLLGNWYGLKKEDIKRLTLNSIHMAFATDEEKEKLRDKVRAYDERSMDIKESYLK